MAGLHDQDDGKTWTNLTAKFPNVPKDAYISRLAASAHDANTVYATFDNHATTTTNTYVYASADGGNNFRSIGEGIPKGTGRRSDGRGSEEPERALCGHRVRPVLSPDRGGSWKRIRAACRPCRFTRS